MRKINLMSCDAILIFFFIFETWFSMMMIKQRNMNNITSNITSVLHFGGVENSQDNPQEIYDKVRLK